MILKLPIFKTAPPRPKTNILAHIITFLVFEKSSLFLTITSNPLTLINPYKSRDILPRTILGIVLKIAVNLPKNDMIIANIAASIITLTDATFVIPTTLVFSPYVVLAGPPNEPATNVAKPSPSKVLSNPGSFIKSLPIISPKTV